jgi:hypothetical protein
MHIINYRADAVAVAVAEDRHGTPEASHELGPILVSAEDAFTALGIGRTKGFELIRNGRLAARKLGSRTLVEFASLRALVQSLPRAGEKR